MNCDYMQVQGQHPAVKTLRKVLVGALMQSHKPIKYFCIKIGKIYSFPQKFYKQTARVLTMSSIGDIWITVLNSTWGES